MRTMLRRLLRLVTVPTLVACAQSATETTTGAVPPMTALRVAVRDTSLVAGDTVQLTVSRLGTASEAGTLAFASSDTVIAWVNASGLVTTRAAGAAIITVRQSTSSATVAFTIAPAVPQPVDTQPAPPRAPPSASAWLEVFAGAPPAPVSFQSADWNVQQYSRDEETWLMPSPMEAQHAHDCGGPPLVHTITTYAQQVFRCRDHMMTALNEGGYGAIVLTPNRMLDWGSGEQVLRFAVSTASQSTRDWWAVWLTPWSEVLPVPAHDWAPGLNGYPRTSLLLEQGKGGVCPALVMNHVRSALPCNNWQALSERMTVSFSVRSVIEVRLSRTHIKVWMPEQGIVFSDTDIPTPLAFTRGVVQFAHYSYNPSKDCPAGQTCGPNTWHWDDVTMSAPASFGIMNADVREVHTDNARVTFASGAPANAMLHLTAGGYHPLLSFNDGVTWVQPRAAPFKPKDAAESQYVAPIPQGVSSVRVKRGPIMVSWWPRGWIARDFTIWAQ